MVVNLKTAVQPTLQRWQGASRLDYRRERALCWQQSGTAAGSVPRRDQMMASMTMGVVRSKLLTKEHAATRSWLCFLPIAAFLNTRRHMACRYGSMQWSCIGRGNGARAG